jgi:hypothetical protein
MVAGTVRMGATVCVNVRTRVVNVETPAVVAASPDGMVSAAFIAAGVSLTRVSMHARGGDSALPLDSRRSEAV